MPRYAAEVAYVGASFAGFQAQPNRPSVQGVLEAALEALSGSPVRCHGAGRTDAGVHARGQVVHFDLPRPWDPFRLRGAMAAHLPPSVEILQVAQVPDSFHARFDALWREYRFFLWNQAACVPHLRPFVWWVKSPLDWTLVQHLLPSLRGRHDFGAFCRSVDRPEDSWRTLLHVSCRRRGPFIRFRFRGDGFLTNMVRILVGTLEGVARGGMEPEAFLNLLEGGCRSEAGRTAPPQGLFFWRVGYAPSPWATPSSFHDRVQ